MDLRIRLVFAVTWFTMEVATNGCKGKREIKMKLFKREQQDVFARLDELMMLMASDETYNEYIIVREGINNGNSN
jgi:hypothetical protein